MKNKSYCMTARNVQKKKWLFFLIGFIFIAILSIRIGMYCKETRRDYIPPEFETNVTAIDKTIEMEETYTILDVAKGYRVGICGQPVWENNRLTVYFANPIENEVWMKLCILDENKTILCETGLIRPGECIKHVGIQNIAENKTLIQMKVMGYEPNTYYSMGEITLDTSISIKF